MELPKNCIKIGEQIIEVAPKTEQDCQVISSACANILGYVLAVGTSGIADSSKRVELILKLSGKIAGAAATEALKKIAETEVTVSKGKKEEKTNGGNA